MDPMKLALEVQRISNLPDFASDTHLQQKCDRLIRLLMEQASTSPPEV